MKSTLIYSVLAIALFATTAHARPLDTRNMTCDQVRSVVRASGSGGVAMYSQFGYSVVFAPRAATCRAGYVAEGAFVRTKDFSHFRRCPAGWTCVYDNNNRH